MSSAVAALYSKVPDLQALFSEIGDLCRRPTFASLSPLHSTTLPVPPGHPKNKTELKSLFTEINQYLGDKLPERLTGLDGETVSTGGNGNVFKKPKTPPRCQTKVFRHRGIEKTKAKVSSPLLKKKSIASSGKAKVEWIFKEIDTFFRLDLPGGRLTGLDNIEPHSDCKSRSSSSTLKSTIARLKHNSDENVLTTVIRPVEVDKGLQLVKALPCKAFITPAYAINNNNSDYVERRKSNSTLTKEKNDRLSVIFPGGTPDDEILPKNGVEPIQVKQITDSVHSKTVETSISKSSLPPPLSNSTSDSCNLIFPDVFDYGEEKHSSIETSSDLNAQEDKSTCKNESSRVDHMVSGISDLLSGLEKEDEDKVSKSPFEKKGRLTSSCKPHSAASSVVNSKLTCIKRRITTKPTVIYITPSELEKDIPTDLFGDFPNNLNNGGGDYDLVKQPSQPKCTHVTLASVEKEPNAVILPHDRLSSLSIDSKRVPKTNVELDDLFKEISDFCRVDLPFRLMDLEEPDQLRLPTKKIEPKESEEMMPKPKLSVVTRSKKQLAKIVPEDVYKTNGLSLTMNPFVSFCKINNSKSMSNEKTAPTTTIVQVTSDLNSDSNGSSTKRKRGWRKNSNNVDQQQQTQVSSSSQSSPPPTTTTKNTLGGFFDLKSSLQFARSFISSAKASTESDKKSSETKPPKSKTTGRARKKLKRDPSEMNDSGYSSQGSIPSPVPSDLDSIVSRSMSLSSSSSSLVRAEAGRPQVYLYSQYDYYTDLASRPKSKRKSRGESQAIKRIRVMFDQNQKVLEWRQKNFPDSNCPPTPPLLDFRETPPPTPTQFTDNTQHNDNDDYLDLDCFHHECQFQLDDDDNDGKGGDGDSDQWLKDMFQDQKPPSLLDSLF